MTKCFLSMFVAVIATACSRQPREAAALPSIQIETRRYGTGEYFAKEVAILNTNVIWQFNNMVRTATKFEPYKQDPFCRMVLQMSNRSSQTYDFRPYWRRHGSVQYRLCSGKGDRSTGSQGLYSLPVATVQQWCIEAGISFEKFFVQPVNRSLRNGNKARNDSRP